MEEIRKAVYETDSRLIINSLDVIKDGKNRAVFITVLVPYEISQNDLLSLHYALITKICSLDACYECAAALKMAAAA